MSDNVNEMMHEFYRVVESRDCFLKKPFNYGDAGDRFYFSKKKSKAAGRYKFVDGYLTKSGSPMIMVSFFEGGSVSETMYIWAKSEQGRDAIASKKSNVDYVAKRAAREKAEQEKQIASRQKAEQEFNQLRDPKANPLQHPYIQRKGCRTVGGCIIAKHDMRIESVDNGNASEGNKRYTVIRKGDLIIPSRNIDGDFVTYQRINERGEKRQRVDVSTVGAFHLLGSLTDEVIFLCEGFATADSLHFVTGRTVLACYDVNNVGVVAGLIKERFPDTLVIIATDNDRNKTGKIGLLKGFEYSFSYNMPFIFPKFDRLDDSVDKTQLSDWNDLLLHMSAIEIQQIIACQVDYYMNHGCDDTILKAAKAYDVSLSQLERYADQNKFRVPGLFCTIISDD